MMKFSPVLLCIALFCALFASTAFAKEIVEQKEEAAQYYLEQNYKKAYKIYYKLAKMGDHQSQDQLAVMFARGEGKDIDFEKAYAWSVLAAEGGDDILTIQSEELLQQVDDKAGAENQASRLMKKYGRDALLDKAEKQEMRRLSRQMGGCTGSKRGCSGP
jgi:TPR repeat protein